MSVEHRDQQPEFSIETSRRKLQGIVEYEIEVSDETLFNSIQDVLASRVGERWKKIDECWLSTEAGLSVVVGYDEPIESAPWETVWMQITQGDETKKYYEVRKRSESGVAGYELGEVDDPELETEEFNPVSNYGNLAAARLLSILADAHQFTSLEDQSVS